MLKKYGSKAIICILLAGFSQISVSANLNSAMIQALVKNYLAAQKPIRQWKIGPLDPQLQVPMCTSLQFQLKITMVDVFCPSQGWRINVPVTAQTQSQMPPPVWVMARAMQRGEIIKAEDLVLQSIDNPSLRQMGVTDAKVLIGKMLRIGVTQGSVIRSSNVQAAQVVLARQTVKVIFRADGFDISADGIAQNAAAVGELVNVRMPSGRTIQGRVDESGRVFLESE